METETEQRRACSASEHARSSPSLSAGRAISATGRPSSRSTRVISRSSAISRANEETARDPTIQPRRERDER